MDTTKLYTTVAGAAKDYFGAVSASAWMQEWKCLTDTDKAEIREGLAYNGYQIKTA